MDLLLDFGFSLLIVNHTMESLICLHSLEILSIQYKPGSLLLMVKFFKTHFKYEIAIHIFMIVFKQF